MKKLLKNRNGITLIALVITIIVLLILAGVSIAMLTGDNGILTQATEAKEKNTIGEEEERISLALQSLKMKKQADNVSTTVTSAELQKREKEQISLALQSLRMKKQADNVTDEITASELDEQLKYDGAKNVTVESGENNKLIVKYQESKNLYTVDQNGNIDNLGTGEGGNIPSTGDTKPFLPDGAEVIEDDFSKGVVIKDRNGNEWNGQIKM